MRRYLFVFGSILAYLLFCSKSCDSPQSEEVEASENKIAILKDSIRNEFVIEDLSRKTLRAFEMKAQEKLIDFADYLNIYSEKTLDATLKNQVRNSIVDLFISDTVLIDMKIHEATRSREKTLNEFLILDFAPEFDSVLFQFDSIEIFTPLHRKDELRYAGILKFSQRIQIYTPADSKFLVCEKKKAEFFAVKVNTAFGADTLKIWRVLIGSIQ